MQIQIRINEEGALRNQRFAFTDRFTLVTELLQNARRAGAFHIAVEHLAEEQVLRVHDDGHGIEDFQKLLSFHESGWDDDTVTQEHPFGIGFTKGLYAATRIVAASGQLRVDIDTAAALRREAFEVETMAQAVAGTTIELHGVEIADLDNRMETLCEGFPVDVVFNGKPMERRYADDHLALVPTPIGAVHVAGNGSGKATRDTLVFLQGFCVKRPIYFKADHVNVIHLDPQQFMARLPDRDTLIDADQQLRRIEAQVKQSWRRILEVAKTQLKPQDFVATYFDAMLQWHHQDLLNDVDELPAALFRCISGYPFQTHYGQQGFLEPAAAPTRGKPVNSRARCTSAAASRRVAFPVTDNHDDNGVPAARGAAPARSASPTNTLHSASTRPRTRRAAETHANRAASPSPARSGSTRSSRASIAAKAAPALTNPVVFVIHPS